MVDKREPCPAEDLQVIGISESEWRIADGRLSDSSPAKVLGFVQRRGEGFDVLTLDTPDRNLFFPAWADAIASFSVLSQAKPVRTPVFPTIRKNKRAGY